MNTSEYTQHTVKEMTANLSRACQTGTAKRRWIEHYSRRMLKLWSRWETDLGVARAYANQIKSDLAEFYKDPLKKMFIEATY